MITPKLKDEVLNAIIIRYNDTNSDRFDIDCEESFPEKTLSDSDFRMILHQFKEKQLLSVVDNLTGNSYYIHVTANLFDFYNHGGFVCQEEILLANLKKLDCEFKKLAKEVDPGLSEKIGRIAEIAASCAIALGFFRS